MINNRLLKVIVQKLLQNAHMQRPDILMYKSTENICACNLELKFSLRKSYFFLKLQYSLKIIVYPKCHPKN